MSILREIDRLWIERLQAGDERAFKHIYDLLHKQVYVLIFSLMKDRERSEDILQETFINLWLHKEKLSADQPLVPFLYVTARRLTIDAFRKVASESHFKESLAFTLTECSEETEHRILLNDLSQYAENIIETLPPQQQLVYRLSRQQDLSYDEIAVLMKISRNTVRNHLVSALKTLRKALTHFFEKK
ncbi:RNA polymerase sigma-70 factor, ECF subfamily [bacterium A37T11]|nr:RNA polymerase sigma-70 factor, ECF subfamily [bacterium A37T11]